MWNFIFDKSGTPLYLQIANALENDVLSGELPPGHRLMSHRELAHITGVTVSTVTRAYAEAEHRGLIKTEAGRGTFVTAMPSATTPDAGEGTIIEMGVPMPLYLDEPSIRPVLLKVAQEENVEALAKCFAPSGFTHHREVAAGWLGRSGLAVTADSLLIAAGHPHGLHSIFYALFTRSDKIAVGEMTNPSFMSLARQAGFSLKSVKMDEDGMVPEELDALCRAEDIKGIYITAGINNVSTKSMPWERREALAKIIANYNLILVEDGSYCAPEIGKTPPIASLLPENSLYLISFSSVMYSALRVAFIHASPRFHKRLVQTLVENMWTVPPLCVALVCECITNGMADRVIKNKRKEIARRVGVLRETLSGFDVLCSEQSIFAWVRLPDLWNMRDFEFLAEKSGVRVLAADRLAVNKAAAPNSIRLSVTGTPEMSSFKRGLDILVGLLNREEGTTHPVW